MGSVTADVSKHPVIDAPGRSRRRASVAATSAAAVATAVSTALESERLETATRFVGIEDRQARLESKLDLIIAALEESRNSSSREKSRKKTKRAGASKPKIIAHANDSETDEDSEESSGSSENVTHL